jgi:hypothetical protein
MQDSQTKINEVVFLKQILSTISLINIIDGEPGVPARLDSIN